MDQRRLDAAQRHRNRTDDEHLEPRLVRYDHDREPGIPAVEIVGYLGQEQIGFNDRLYFQFGARIDRNSAFGSSAPTFFLPKFGATYTVTEEPAIQRHLPSFISTFRVRAAWGTTGRSPGSTDALQTYSKSPYLTDLALVQPGVSPGSPGNANIKPERGIELEGGFDAGFFHDRLGLRAHVLQQDD